MVAERESAVLPRARAVHLLTTHRKTRPAARRSVRQDGGNSMFEKQEVQFVLFIVRVVLVVVIDAANGALLASRHSVK